MTDSTQSGGGGRIHEHVADATSARKQKKTSDELMREQTLLRQQAALQTVLQGIDRVMSNQDIVVKAEPGGNGIAWTDGSTIHLNSELMERLFESNELTEAIMTFKGTNYHELAHVLFSPRVKDELKQ